MQKEGRKQIWETGLLWTGRIAGACGLIVLLLTAGGIHARLSRSASLPSRIEAHGTTYRLWSPSERKTAETPVSQETDGQRTDAENL